MLHRFVEFIQPLAAGLGGPGLSLLAFIDSFLSLPEVPDLALVWLVVQHPARWPYYAMMATGGSLVGCYLTYLIARKGGEAMMRRRFRGPTLERALSVLHRYGLLAVVVPSILPPPAPFKLFIILAGVSGIPAGPFIGAILIGRGFRFTAEALLAYFYGETAIRYINENMGRASLVMAALVVTGGLAFIVWRRRRAKTAKSVEN